MLMLYFRRLFLSSIFYLFVFETIAGVSDTIKKPFTLGGKFHYGTILPHSEVIRHLAFNHPYGAEITFNWLNHSKKAVEQLSCYSYTGFAINYVNFGHHKIGSAINAFFFFEPLLRFQKKFSYGIRAGFGANYLTKIYDEDKNPENKFFASHISGLLMLEFKLKYRMAKKLDLTTSVCYNHISNGGIKQPNYGMNFPTITIGADYHFKPVVLKPIKKPAFDKSKKVWTVKAEALFSVKVSSKTEQFNEEAFLAYGVSLFANKRLARVSAVNFGLEYIDDYFAKDEVRRAGLSCDYRRLGAFIGHDLIFGKFNFTINLGANFYNPFRRKRTFYQKYLFQYKISQHFYSGVCMLAFGDAAEIMGFNVGYVF